MRTSYRRLEHENVGPEWRALSCARFAQTVFAELREMLWGGWQARATSMSTATCEERQRSRQPKASRRLSCAFFAFPALLIDTEPLRVCALLAPWKDKNRQQRGMAGYFTRLRRAVPVRLPAGLELQRVLVSSNRDRATSLYRAAPDPSPRAFRNQRSPRTGVPISS